MNLRAWWTGLGQARRVGLVVGGVLILGLAAIATYFVLRVQYVPLFASADTQDNAAIIARLEALGADYRLEADSGQVTVPEEQRNALRLKLVERGLPAKGSTGFELFDNADFGMTEFSQKINYQRALEGELARTIMTLDSVRFARLHLVLPESSLFKRDREQPKASVTLVTLQDRVLTPDQIAGIQRLVASAVPGLAPELVSVHDHRGVNLVGSDGAGGPVAGRVKAKQTYESYLSAKIRGLLAPLFPGAQLAVSVDATLRLDKVSTTREETLPARGGARYRSPASKQNASDTLTRNPDGSTVLTLGSNGSAGTVSQDGDGRFSREVDQIEELPGTIERLSIGVIVPNASPSTTSIDEIKDLVASAAGIDFPRGDRIAVYTVNLPTGADKAKDLITDKNGSADDPTAPAPQNTLAKAVVSAPYLLFATLIVLALVVGIFIVRLFRGNTSESQLSEAEREVLLQKIRAWLQEDESSGAARS